MSLTISPNPSFPPLHKKLSHNIILLKPQSSQNSIFTKPIFTSKTLNQKGSTFKSFASSFGVNPSLVSDNSSNPFGKFHDFVPKFESFLHSCFGYFGAQLGNAKVLRVELNADVKAKWVTVWALVEFIGSLWPCSVQQGYLFSTGIHGIQIASGPAFLRPGSGNLNVCKSRFSVSAFNNSDRRLPKKEEQKMMHEGLITESLPNAMFRVQLDNKDMIIGYISGKMRKNFIRILPGDRVKVEVSRYDSTRGRIVLRLRNKPSTE